MYMMNISYEAEYIDIKEINMLVNVLIPINNAMLFFTKLSWQLRGIYYKLWYYYCIYDLLALVVRGF